MSYLDKVLEMSFAGFTFPVTSYSVKGALRHHVHEYPHAPGGAVEPLGRALYRITCAVPAHENLRKYPQVLQTVASLRVLAEGEQPWDLVIPHIGTMSARLIEWSDDIQVRIRSGYAVSFTFLEDQTQQFLVDKMVVPSTEILPAVDTLKTLVASRDTTDLLPDVTDPAVRLAILEAEDAAFDSLFTMIDEVLTITQGDDLYSAIVRQKIENVTERCAEMNRSLRTLNEWPTYAVLDALSETWATVARVANDLAKKDRQLDTYVTRAIGSVVDVAAAIYGDTSRAMELLRLNAFDDALVIPLGTVVYYYADVVNSAA